MDFLNNLSWDEVKDHYDNRKKAHKEIIKLYKNKNMPKYANMALGISNIFGNFSSNEHRHGPRILRSNPRAEQRIFNLAEKFRTLTEAKTVPNLIHEERISYLKIGIGSEISCMINPTVCWIANTRTIWAHLLLKHNGNYARADEELELYRNEDESSEMAYKKWAAIHADMGSSMRDIATEGLARAGSASIGTGVLTYLWADAIANQLYADQYE